MPLEGSKKRENWALLPHGEVIFSDTVAPLASETPPPVGAGDAEGRADRDTVKRSVALPKTVVVPVTLPASLTEAHAEAVAERLGRAEGVEAADSEPLTVAVALAEGEAVPVTVAEDPPPAEKRTTSPELELMK